MTIREMRGDPILMTQGIMGEMIGDMIDTEMRGRITDGAVPDHPDPMTGIIPGITGTTLGTTHVADAMDMMNFNFQEGIITSKDQIILKGQANIKWWDMESLINLLHDKCDSG